MPVNNLSPFQLATQAAVGSGKNGHLKLTPEILGQIADQMFGPAPIEPGSQILFQDAGRVEWIDPQGYRHSATRSLNGVDPGVGQWRDNTDRPAVLPPSQGTQQLQGTLTRGTQSLAEQQLANLLAQARGERVAAFDPGISADLDAIRALAGQLQGGPQLFAPDAETQGMLDAITARDRAFLEQQFGQQQGDLIARLYGNGINRSSIANAAAGQLLQQQGLVTAQGQADAAQRELAVRQYLGNLQQEQRQLALQGLLGAASGQLEGFKASTAAGQDQNNALMQLLNSLIGQQTQRDIANAGINVDYARLAEEARQANQRFELGQQEQDRLLAQTRKSGLSQVLGGLSAIASIAGAPFTGGASLAGLAGSLFGGGRPSGSIYGAGTTWPQN